MKQSLRASPSVKVCVSMCARTPEQRKGSWLAPCITSEEQRHSNLFPEASAARRSEKLGERAWEAKRRGRRAGRWEEKQRFRNRNVKGGADSGMLSQRLRADEDLGLKAGSPYHEEATQQHEANPLFFGS